MVRHSEDWWGVLRQGIESEYTRLGSVGFGLGGCAWVSLGMEIELENMERQGTFRIGMMRLC